MPILFVAIFLCSCSPKQEQNNILPDYSDMSAADDAMRAK